MQSEWMVEVPMTFATDWLAMPVPEGKRNLVITNSMAHAQVFQHLPIITWTLVTTIPECGLI